MSVGKAVVLSLVLVAVFVVGVIIGPSVQRRWFARDSGAVAVATPSAETATPAPQPKVERRAPRAKAPAVRSDDVVAAKRSPDTIQSMPVAVWEPELRDRAKNVLSPGARLDDAVAEFDNAEQFMTVAHAARNTKVPFMLLKDGLLNRGKSLSETIRELRPELDAKAEVKRARNEAREDLELAS